MDPSFSMEISCHAYIISANAYYYARHRAFPTGSDVVWGSLPHQLKICSDTHRFPHPYTPLHQIFIFIRRRISCYNPIKTSFLAVVIAPVQFHTLCTHRSCLF